MTIINKLKKLPELNYMLILAVFCFGILSIEFLPIYASIIIALCLFISSFLSKRHFAIILSIIFLLGALLYFTYRLVPNNDISRLNSYDIKSVEGIIVSDIEKHKNSYLFYVKVNNVTTIKNTMTSSGKVLCYLKTNLSINQGDKIKINGFFYKPNPQTNPIKFDYNTYLSRKNIYVCTSINDKNKVSIIEKHSPPLIKQTKNYIEKIFSKYLDSKAKDLLMGMVLGNGNYLDDNTYNNFINTSTLHLLAASGLNCAVLCGLLWFLFFFLEFRKRYLLTIPILWFYTILINCPSSILRAALMCSLFMLFKCFKVHTSFKGILYLSALIILVFNPSELFDVGFQLSYLCLWGLLYICPLLNKYIFKYYHSQIKNPSSLKKAFYDIFYLPISLGISSYIGVNIILIPITIYYFNYFSFVGIFANIIVASLASLIFILAFILLLFNFLGYIGLGFAINFVSKFILYVVNTLGQWEYSTKLIATPNIFIIIISYLIIFSLFIYLNIKSMEKKQKIIDKMIKSKDKTLMDKEFGENSFME